eukprot:5199357-Lingulodinium_polyedra.AAC.1
MDRAGDRPLRRHRARKRMAKTRAPPPAGSAGRGRTCRERASQMGRPRRSPWGRARARPYLARALAGRRH